MSAGTITAVAGALVAVIGAATALVKAFRTGTKVDDHIASVAAHQAQQQPPATP